MESRFVLGSASRALIRRRVVLLRISFLRFSSVLNARLLIQP